MFICHRFYSLSKHLIFVASIQKSTPFVQHQHHRLISTRIQFRFPTKPKTHFFATLSFCSTRNFQSLSISPCIAFCCCNHSNRKKHQQKFIAANVIKTNHNNNNNDSKHKHTMGAINCRESKTNRGDSCANPTTCGTTGVYQQTEKETKENDANMPTEEYTEPIKVGQFNDLNENEMKQVNLFDNHKALLIKQNGQLTAIGNKCTHYGAPLHTGALGVGRVRCPWHGACFDIHSGDIEDFPGLDSLPCYKVQVDDNGDVKISAKRSDLEKNKRLKDMVARNAEDQRCFVIIGGGPAGGVCAETLRQEGYTGRIVMICKENALPYDRVKISKSMNLELESLQFRDKKFYAEHGIELLLNVEATEVNSKDKAVACSNSAVINYDKLFIATGCRAMKPPIEGADLKNVFTIRAHADAFEIDQTVNEQTRVVCLGASFIALEAASALVGKALSVTLVGREDVPLKQSFGKEIGARVLRLFKEKNVEMLMNSGITKIVGNAEGKVVEVVLKDGSSLPCDLLIMGTGSRFYTEFLANSGLQINSNGSINTDAFLCTNVMDIYAGGDIANAPVFAINSERATIGHYQLAQYHGRIAGKNMAGTMQQQLRAVPFFFTMLFGKGFRYSGYGDYSDIYIDGDLEELKFAAYFLNKENRVIAVASCARDPIVSHFQELLSQGKTLQLSDVKDAKDKTEWTKLLFTDTHCL